MTRGRRRWLVPVIVLACVPFMVVFLAFALVPVGIWAMAGEGDAPAEIRKVRWLPHLVRGAFLSIAVLGLVALINDVNALS